jgi:predicted ATP-grasp superfamily ATP-dependent carboligase
LGNAAAVIARAKDPASFFPLLDDLGVRHPQTDLSRPSHPDGWLSKRIGGSGGAHVLACAKARSGKGRYFQRRLQGDPVSLLAVADAEDLAVVGFSRQWTVGTEPRPFRYGGAAGPARLQTAAETLMTDAARTIARELGLVGLVSFDFLLVDSVPLLLEVNPRPGATLDVFDGAAGALFAAHVAACRGEPVALGPIPPAEARAAAILYADRGPLTPDAPEWPQWTADRPMPGTRIPRHRPIATVFAAGETATAAELNCRRRLDELASMLYGRAPETERNNAETYRPRPERVSAGS